MMEKALSKVPEQCKATLDIIHEMLVEYPIDKAWQVHQEYRKQLSGYIKCLIDIGTIKEKEGRCLYEYYSQ